MVKTLGHLAKVAKLTGKSLAGDDLKSMTEAYREWGWKVDAAMLKAYQEITTEEQIVAVETVIKAIYLPWLRASAEIFQNNVHQKGYSYSCEPLPTEGACVLFSDALRLDLGQILAEELQERGLVCEVGTRFSALPTITSTAKHAIFDFGEVLVGDKNTKLTPHHKDKKSPINAGSFRDLLKTKGFQILIENDLGDPSGFAWTEIGSIDAIGHQRGLDIPQHLNDEISLIADRIQNLLDFGWKEVRVVTDHGWLYVPGGMQKDELPEHLTVMRKGRCAELKPNVQTDYLQVPWYWNEEVMVAIAPGINCFEAGKEYEHGGISLQECVTPIISITKQRDIDVNIVSITEYNWRGLRFTANLTATSQGMIVDIRKSAGDPLSSVCEESSPDRDNKVSILIEDDDLIGESAYIVVIDRNGQILWQEQTTIGE